MKQHPVDLALYVLEIAQHLIHLYALKHLLYVVQEEFHSVQILQDQIQNVYLRMAIQAAALHQAVAVALRTRLFV